MNSLNTDQASKSADIRSEMKPEETLSTVSLELIPENNTHSLNLTTTSNASIINHSTRNVESLPTTSVIVNSSYQPSIDEKNSCDKKSNHQNKTVTSAETSKVHDCVTGASNLSESPISENSSKSSRVVDTEYPEVRNDMTSYFATNEIPSVTVASGRSVGGVKANEKDLIRNNEKIQSQQTSSMLLPSTLEPNRKIGKCLFKLGSPCRKLGKENEPTKLSKSRTLDKKLSCDTLKGVEDTNIKTKSGSAENLNKATAAVSPCKSLTLPRNSSSNFGRFPKVTRIWQRIVGKWPKSHLKSGKMTASLDSACQTDDDFFENSGLDSNSGVSCRVAGSCSAHGFCNGNRRSCRVEAENESVRNSESGTSASGGRLLVENGHHASDFQIGQVIGNSGQDGLQDNVSEISARPLVAASSLSSSLLTPVELQTAGVLRGAATSHGAYRNFCCGSCDLSSSRRLSLTRNSESHRGVSAICSSNVSMESPAEDIRNEAVVVSPDNDEYPPALYPRGASVSAVHTQVDYIHYLVPGLERIARCSYYWGVMDRYEAERLLDGRPDGTFLLRDSAQDDFLFSVSFRRYGRSLHARIEQGGHQFSFDSHDPSVFSSPSVCELIEHYKDPASCMFFEPLLTTPLVRNQPFSLRSLCRTAICSITSYDSISALPIPHSQRDYLRHYHYKHKVYVRRFEAPPPVPGDTANLRVKQDENEIEECD